jgi:hypothetical protein
MNSQWYYTRDRKSKIGPVSVDVLRQLAQCGQLLPTDMVQEVGSGRWTTATLVPGLSFPPSMPYQAPARQVVPSSPGTSSAFNTEAIKKWWAGLKPAAKGGVVAGVLSLFCCTCLVPVGMIGGGGRSEVAYQTSKPGKEGEKNGQPSQKGEPGQEDKSLNLLNGPLPIAPFIAALQSTRNLKLLSPDDGYEVYGSQVAASSLFKAVEGRFAKPYRYHIGRMSGSYKQELAVILLQAGPNKQLVGLLIAHDFDRTNPDAKSNDHNSVILLVENSLLPGCEYRKHFRANIPQILGNGAEMTCGKASVITGFVGKELQVQITYAGQ